MTLKSTQSSGGGIRRMLLGDLGKSRLGCPRAGKMPALQKLNMLRFSFLRKIWLAPNDCAMTRAIKVARGLFKPRFAEDLI